MTSRLYLVDPQAARLVAALSQVKETAGRWPYEATSADLLAACSAAADEAAQIPPADVRRLVGGRS